MMRIVCIALLVTVWLQPVMAADIDEVVSVSPSWPTFTQKDGTGLYHEILSEIFGLYGVTVRHEYAKSNRAEHLVINGQADMMTCSDIAKPPLVLGRYPMYKNDYFVFFRKDRIGQWKGMASLRDKEILHQPSFYSEENFSVPVKLKVVSTGCQAVDIVNLGRSDFYVDDMSLIKQSLSNASTELDMTDFDIKRVGRRSYHPLFNTTERGKAIREMYDEGIYALHKSGELRPIYEKWGHQYPRFDEY